MAQPQRLPDPHPRREQQHEQQPADGGRHFHVLVAFGPKAPATVQRQAWQILDSLKSDPRVRPDWRSSG
jgi:hypothetical protein